MKTCLASPAAKLAAAMALALALAACSEPPPPAAAARLVRTQKVGAGDTAGTAALRGYSGEVRARVETTLAFRVPGKLIERTVDAGSTVKAGQVLARLDGNDTALQAAQAEAQRALAAADLARFRELRAKNFISASALDARETALKAAEAQAGLARNQAAYAVLTADRAGVIGQVLAEPGQVVGAGQPVFRMAPDGEREIAIALPENEVAGFRIGQAAEVRLWSGDAQPIAGLLREVSPVADPVTRTYAARVSLKNADPRLPLGMSATVRFPPGQGGATDSRLRVPLTAIYQKDGKTAVWLVSADRKLSLRPITVAAWEDTGAVVAEGLAGSEEIVVAGVNRLTEGEQVRVAAAAKVAAQ